MAWLPLRLFEPLQPPEAMQEVAFVLAQVSVAELPDLTLLGLALSVTVGAERETVTVADCEAVPPAPMQVNSNSVVPVRVPVDIVPLVAMLPCQPPEAVQALTPADFQMSVELSPLPTVVGEALNVTDAVAVASIDTATDRVVVPPVPVQANE